MKGKNPIEQYMKYVVRIERADETLRNLCETYLCERFTPEERIFSELKARLEEELEPVKKYGFASIYLHYHDLIHRNGLRPSQYMVSGTAASSVICFLLGITKENPCNASEPLYQEFFAGVEGNREPDIDLEVAPDVYRQIVRSIDDLPGVEKGVRFSFIQTPVGAKYRDGIMIVPKGMDAGKFFSLNRTEDGTEEILFFSRYDLEHRFVIYDIHENGECGLLARLEEITGDIPEDTNLRSDLQIQKTLHAGENPTFTREDLLERLLDYGLDGKQAATVAEAVRKGYGKKANKVPVYEAVLREHRVPEGLIRECRHTEYLPSRAEFAEREQLQRRLCYYKLYYPEQYEKATKTL